MVGGVVDQTIVLFMSYVECGDRPLEELVDAALMDLENLGTSASGVLRRYREPLTGRPTATGLGRLAHRALPCAGQIADRLSRPDGKPT